MSLHRLLAYLVSDWIEWAGFITAVIGIWYSTKRKVINWPITLVSTFSTSSYSWRANLCRAHGSVAFSHSHSMAGGIGLTEQNKAMASALRSRPGAHSSSLSCWVPSVAACGAGSWPARGPHSLCRRSGLRLQPRRHLVGDEKAHRKLVAVDRCEYSRRWGIHIRKALGPRSFST